jgi:glycosidase
MRRISSVALFLLACCCGTNAPAPLVPASREPSASTEWWNGAVVYEVFVRSFRDSDGDGTGDLAGLIEKLDYLNDGNDATSTDLGIDALWLMPIYPSPSYHGYDVSDYDGVNAQYGTSAQLDQLIAACHQRGIKVLLDFVPNHTSNQHPWFVDAASSRGSARRDWYVWSSTNPGWTQPFGSAAAWHQTGSGDWYYGVFSSSMPDLNWRTPAVRAEMDAIASRWLARGVDGFRLDAVRYLVEDGAGLQQDRPDTHTYLASWRANALAANPRAMLVGEAWADTATIATYYAGGDLPLFFNFPLADAVVTGVATGSAWTAAAALDSVARAYPPGSGDAPFLTNHDQERVASRLGADPAKLKLAAAVLLTLQGTPIIYYGEEIGMLNGGCASDECKRTPMAWDATAHAGFTAGTPWWPLAPGTVDANVVSQTGDPSSLLSRYRQLIRVRKGSSALSRGGTNRLSTEDANVLSWLRTEPGGETVLVAHNFGAAVAMVHATAPGTSAEALLADPGAGLAPAAGGWSLTLPPYGSAIWRVR